MPRITKLEDLPSMPLLLFSLAKRFTINFDKKCEGVHCKGEKAVYIMHSDDNISYMCELCKQLLTGEWFSEKSKKRVCWQCGEIGYHIYYNSSKDAYRCDDCYRKESEEQLQTELIEKYK